MKLSLNKKLAITSTLLSLVFVKSLENVFKFCPPELPEICYDCPGCEKGFPIHYISTGGFFGYQTFWPIFLLDILIVAAFIFVIVKYAFKITQKNK